MKAIVTGAAGFIGANLARRLLRDKHEVHVLALDGDSLWRIRDILSHLDVHVVSLTDSGKLTSVITSINPDWIFHLAVHGAYSSQQDMRRIVDTNILGTVNLVEAALKTDFKAFINTGSSSEYGFQNHPPKENEYIEPNSYYAVTKASATLFCRYTAHETGRKIPTLRLYNIYGAYEEPTRLIPVLIINGLKGKLPPLVNKHIARDLVYIDDTIDAYIMTAEASLKDNGGVYNVGSGEQSTLEDMVEQIRRLLKIEEEPNWGSMEDRGWDTGTWVSNPEKIYKDIGWAYKYDIREGFARTIAWFKDNPKILDYYERAILGNGAG